MANGIPPGSGAAGAERAGVPERGRRVRMRAWLPELSRRDLLRAGAGTLVAAGLGSRAVAATPARDAIAALTGGAPLREGVVELDAPNIAENGNSVPVEVRAPGATGVTLFADGNPEPTLATIRFGTLNPTRRVSTRIRLSRTQNVIAVATMEDGSFRTARAAVKVTIGGCGG